MAAIEILTNMGIFANIQLPHLAWSYDLARFFSGDGV